MHRLLRVDGAAIFFEPLGENPFINLYRKATPHSRTPDETPLSRKDIARITATFPGATIEHFGLTTLNCRRIFFGGRIS
jgi:hypothetical protein